MHSSNLLAKIIEHVGSQNKPSLVVFDLDSTLFNVSPRLEKILLDFANEPKHQKMFPDSIEVLKNIRMLRQDWGIKQALVRAGLDHHHPDFHHAIREYWEKCFFSNGYLKYDLPYEGAVEYVQTLHKLGADIAYLTGRDVARMGVGSLESLKQWDFPIIDGRAELILKPLKGMDDAEFKKDWLAAIPLGKYSKIWFFENEPLNVNKVKDHLEHIEIVFFKSTHSGKAEPHEDIPQIMHYLLSEEN